MLYELKLQTFPNLYSSQTTAEANNLKYVVVSLEALSMFTAQAVRRNQNYRQRLLPSLETYNCNSCSYQFKVNAESLYEAAFCIKNEVDVEPVHSKQKDSRDSVVYV